MAEADSEVQKAFDRLQLPLEACPDDIRAAYRAMSLRSHPDVAPSPSANHDQATLNAAYEIAMAFAEQRSGTLALRRTDVTAIVRAAVSRELAPLAAQRQADKVKRQGLASFRSIRSISWVIGGISGALFLVADRLPDFQTLLGIDQSADKAISVSLCMFAILFAGMGFVLQMWIGRAETHIDDYVSRLDDRRFCASEIARILKYSEKTQFSDIELQEFSSQSRYPIMGFPMLSWRLDLLPILLNRALDHGLVERQDTGVFSPDKPDEYIVKFQPSGLRPPPAPPAPPAFLPEKRVALVMAVGLDMSLVAVTLYLWEVLHTMWAIGTGILAALFTLGTIVLAMECVEARRRARGGKGRGGDV